MNTINLWLITGFFGSGKTTFLKRMLERADKTSLSRTGVIVNEFGKVGIDGQILRKDGFEMIELNNGSVFCSCLKENFIKALVSFLKLPIKTLFVECSGMADPSTITRVLSHIPIVSGEYNYKGTISTVDAKLFPQQVELLEAAPKQVSAADVVLITKKDLATETQLDETLKIVRMLNENAKILTSSFGEVSLSFLEEDVRIPDKNPNTISANNPENRPLSYLLDFGTDMVIKEKLHKFLERVSPILMRCKGFVRTEKGLLQVDAVGEQVSFLPANDGVIENRLVLIGARDKSVWEKVRAVQAEVFG